jgi:hypothetical protein
MTNFNYTDIVTLYDNTGAVQNKGTYTHYTREILLELRDDIDTLGEIFSQTGANWTANNYDWTKGTRYSLSTETKLWLSYIMDMRSACEDLSTTAGISAPSWTITTPLALYKKHDTATISGTVLTQTGADFSTVTNNTDYCYIRGGTGATKGSYKITAHTTTTLTLSGYSGDSSAGDVVFEVQLSGRNATYTDVRLKSLLTDVRTAVLNILDASFTYYVDKINGNDTTGDGSISNPYKTWNKVVTISNATPGDIFFFPGTYTANLTLTAAGNRMQGSALGAVTILPGPPTTMCTAANTEWRNFFFNDGSVVPDNHFSVSGTLDIYNCVFRGYDEGSGGDILQILGGTATVNHCTILGDTGNTTDDGVVRTSNGLTLNDVAIVDCNHGIVGSSGITITENYCMLENNTTDRFGGFTTNISNEHTTSTDPNFLDPVNAYLRDNSDAIDQASDGFDIGAVLDGPYNVLRTASDSMSLGTESTLSKQKYLASDTMIMNSDLETENMNLTVNLALWGLFHTDKNGVLYYIDATDGASAVTSIPDWVYNGACLDMSWDNIAGSVCEVHIAVDDGSDYTKLSWWENNATYPAISTTQTIGTRGYGINLWKNTETDLEWGEDGTASTVTADGPNDQKWDITLKIRVRNVSTNVWSEVVTLSKTYYFNDFDQLMYYCADNPRCVDGEYANHANYFAQTYHTGTNKYTRVDGVDWINDGRRFSYNPSTKIYYHFTPFSGTSSWENGFWVGTTYGRLYHNWSERKIGIVGGFEDFAINGADVRFGIYVGLYSNYGNYNTAELTASLLTTIKSMETVQRTLTPHP